MGNPDFASFDGQNFGCVVFASRNATDRCAIGEPVGTLTVPASQSSVLTRALRLVFSAGSDVCETSR